MTILILLTDKLINHYCNSSVLEIVFRQFQFKGPVICSKGG